MWEEFIGNGVHHVGVGSVHHGLAVRECVLWPKNKAKYLQGLLVVLAMSISEQLLIIVWDCTKNPFRYKSSYYNSNFSSMFSGRKLKDSGKVEAFTVLE